MPCVYSRYVVYESPCQVFLSGVVPVLDVQRCALGMRLWGWKVFQFRCECPMACSQDWHIQKGILEAIPNSNLVSQKHRRLGEAVVVVPLRLTKTPVTSRLPSWTPTPPSRTLDIQPTSANIPPSTQSRKSWLLCQTLSNGVPWARLNSRSLCNLPQLLRLGILDNSPFCPNLPVLRPDWGTRERQGHEPSRVPCCTSITADMSSSTSVGFLSRGSSGNSSNMRGLVQFIADLRNARARELEEKRINKELANIRFVP